MASHVSPGPLATVFDRQLEADPHFAGGTGRQPGSGWIDLEDICGSEVLERLARASLRMTGMADRRIAAGTLSRAFGIALGSAVDAYLLDQIVPLPATGGCALLLDFEEVSFRASYTSPRFCGLPSGPHADHADQETVPNVEALRATLTRELLAASGPFIDALCNWSRWSTRAAWGVAISAWVDACIAAAPRATRTPAGIAREIGALVSGMPPGLTRPPFVLALSRGETTVLHQRRGTCCLAYRWPNDHGYCAGCPIVPQTQDVRTVLGADEVGP